MKRTAVLRVVPVVSCLVLAAGCGDSPTSPSDQDPLRLTGFSSRAVVTPASPATLTFRLENTGPRTIELTFTSSCQFMPYIADAAGGQVVYPSGGGWACLAVMTTLTLPPGSVETRTVEVRAAVGGASTPGAVLQPGTYHAYARLEDTNSRLRSTPILLTVQ